MNKTLKISLLTFIAISMATSSLMLQAGDTTTTKNTTISYTLPSARTVLKSGLKVGEKILPYASMIGYFMYVSPKITEWTEKTGGKGMKIGVNEIMKCILGIWFCESIKEDAKAIKAFVSDVYEVVTPA